MTSHFSDLSLKKYLDTFEQKPAQYDLHEVNFQNFALAQTENMTNSELLSLSTAREHSKKRLLRARVYAISTRSDLSWDGKFISDIEKQSLKRKQVLLHCTEINVR